MDLALISLIGILVAIGIGFWKNVNTGLVSIAFALVIGFYMGGLKPNAIIGFWPTNLFFILLGVTLLFSIAKNNGTLEMLARKSVYMTGGNRVLIPIIFFFLPFILASIGPGNISTAALLAPIAMAVAMETKISPTLMGVILVLGSIAGGLSPIAPTGIIGVNLAKDIGLGDLGMYIWTKQFMASLILAAIFYLIFGGLKLKGEKIKITKPEAFSKNQKITLVGILALVVWVIGFKVNVGLAAFFLAVVLLLLKVGDEKKALSGVPWGTLILVCGTGILISVAGELGGIELLTKALASMMGPKTATAIMAITAGVMSFFSSASGVVMPTLINTVPGIVTDLGGAVSPQSLVSAIIVGAHMATPSPISTMGALALAGATEDMNRAKIFKDLLIIAICAVAYAGILGLIGIY